MATLSSPSPWTPEDDVLLKNAIEAGASLEALAKGAVLFSHRFTIRELRDRWQYLLYDEAVSAEASFHMVQCELSSLSSSKGGENLKENSELPRRGKTASVRKYYYAMRKKFISESFGSADACGCEMEGCSKRFPLCNGNCVYGNDISDNYGIHEADMEHPFQHLQGDFTIPPINCSINEMNSDNDDDVSNEIDGEDHLYGFSQDLFDNQTREELKIDNSTTFVQHNEYKKLPFPPTRNILTVDVPVIRSLSDFKSIRSHDGKIHTEFKKNGHFNSPVSKDEHHWETVESFEGSELPINARFVEEPSGVKPLFVNSNHDVNADNLSRDSVTDGRSMLQDTCNGHHITNSMSNLDDDFVYHPDSLFNFDTEDETLFSEMIVDAKDVPICNNDFSPLLLNNKDDVFDDDTHDDIKPSVSGRDMDVAHISASNCFRNGGHFAGSILHSRELFEWKMQCTLNTECHEIPDNDDILFPVKVNSFSKKQNPGETKDAYTYFDRFNSEHDLGLKRKREHNPYPFNPSKVAGSTALSELGCRRLQVDSKVKFELPPQTGNHYGIGSKFLEAKALQNPITSGPDSTKFRYEEPEENALYSDQEEIESDDDIPYFSDVEAMILEMDLGPSNENSNIYKEVSKYQSENTKRTIIRLEQCAQAAIQRSIASKGAFAVLYGRHLKYYISKTEVVLGRATDDSDVDIDLGKEGLANKISRQQAIIKLDQDGSFFLKNLGRTLIFVNGKEVSCSQLVVLSSGCLIEVRGLNFVFEINHELVRQYLRNICK